MQLYSGSDAPTLKGILSPEEINNLTKKILLNIIDDNKEIFKINDDIELNIEIKNIQKLYVNIYEINTENYYYTKNKLIS